MTAVAVPHRAATPRHGVILAATAARVLRQLVHDRRTVALVLVVPSGLLTLLYYLFENQPVPPGVQPPFQRIALILVGVLPFTLMFLITSIAMLRERTSGTLERLLTTPLAKPDLLFGYGIAFGLAAAAQAGVTATVAYGPLGMETAGPAALVLLIAVADAVLGVALGLLCSAFARTEFQAVQFLPVVAIPQMFLCGLFVPRDQMAGWLEAISDWMPLTYAVKALQQVGAHAEATTEMWGSLAVVAACAVVALCLAAGTLRRRSR